MFNQELEAKVMRFARNSRIFGLLDGHGLSRLVAMSHSVRAPAGQVIVAEGDQADCFYLLLDGDVRVWSNGHPDADVARMQGGTFFGELALVGNEPRSANVSAVCDCDLLQFDKDPVISMLTEYPRVKEFIVRLTLNRNEELLERKREQNRDAGLAELLEDEDTHA